MKHQRKFSAQIIAISLAAFAIGITFGAGASTALYITRSSDLSSMLAKATSRVTVLESLLQVASESPASADFEQPKSQPAAAHSPAADETFAAAPVDHPAPPPQPPAPAIEPPRAAVERHDQKSPAPNPKRKAEVDARRQATAVKTTPAPTPARTPTPTVAPAPATVHATPAVATPRPEPQVASPVQTPPAPAVTTDEIAHAVARNPVVGVNAEKLGVGKLIAGAVHLRSGAIIKIGDRFGSGERLLSVDPVNNRIVTSDRQVLVFFGS